MNFLIKKDMNLPLKNLYNYHFWNSFESLRYNEYLESTYQKMKNLTDQNLLQVDLKLGDYGFVFDKMDFEDNGKNKNKKIIGNMQVVNNDTDNMFTENIFGKKAYEFSAFELSENFDVNIIYLLF